MLDFALSLLGTILYPLFSVLFLVIKLAQDLFYAFAGMGDNIYFEGQQVTAGNSGDMWDTGIVYRLLQTELVKDMLISIIMLALVLVLVFTAMAFIKNVYASKPKTWQEIVGNAFKGLANFIFIPVCCLLGVWLGNILLKAINGATSLGGSSYMDRKLFIAAAYNSNEYRRKDKVEDKDIEDIQNLVDKYEIIGSDGDHVEFDANHDPNDVEYFANVVDMVYSETDVSIYDHYHVEIHYQLWGINYLTLVVGGIFMLYVLVSLAFAMIRRMFILLMLFIISPALCAMYPLDDGSAAGQWKKTFIKETIGAYSAVAGMNLFFSLLPLIDKIEYGATGGLLAGLTELFLLVAGLFVVKEFISLIGGYIGSDDAFSKGNSLMKSTTKAIKDYPKTAAQKTGAFVGTTVGALAPAAEGFGKFAKTAADMTGKLAKPVIKKAGQGLHWVGDKAGQGLHWVGDKVGNTKVGKKVGDAASKVGSGVKKAGQWVGDKASKAGHWVGDKASKAGHWVGDKAGKAGRWISNKTGVTGDDLKEMGENAVETGKGLLSGGKGILQSIYKLSGAQAAVEAGAEAYGKSSKEQEGYRKAAKEGDVGQEKAKENVDGLTNSMTGRIDAMSTQVLNAMGDSFAEAMFKKFTKGKTGFDITDLGLTKTSKQSDLAEIDRVLSRLQSYQDRIHNAPSQSVADSIIADAIKFAQTTDAGGNETLQAALDSALGSFLEAQTTYTVDLSGPVEDMVAASKEAAEALAETFKREIKDIAAEVREEKKKKK